MELQPVSSSNIAAVGYDEDTGMMEVEFLNGSAYQYQVDKNVFEQLLTAGSVGQFFSMNVRNNYSANRVR